MYMFFYLTAIVETTEPYWKVVISTVGRVDISFVGKIP
jgi:hypothetical protein